MSRPTTGASVLPFPQRPEDRLRTALRRLEDSLAAQAEAAASFRSSLGHLTTAVNGVDRGLRTYQATLAATQDGVGRLRRSALALQAATESAERHPA